jgi:hypothetical protein
VLPTDIIFYAGDILYDECLQDIGVLIRCQDSLEEYGDSTIKGVPVWRTWWIRAGEEYYSEEGLQHLVALEVFVCYSNYTCFKIEKI